MKNLLIVMVCFILNSCASVKKFKPYSDEMPLNEKNISQNLEVKKDEFKKVTFVTPVSRFVGFDRASQGVIFAPYVGYDHKTKNKYYRLKVTYGGNGWLFMRSLHIICQDGYEYKKSFPPLTVNREVVYGSRIAEIIDYSPSKVAIKKLSECASGKVRLNGKTAYFEQEFNLQDATYFKEARFVWKNMSLGDVHGLGKVKREVAEEKKKKSNKPY
jgi:hypothetical protein